MASKLPSPPTVSTLRALGPEPTTVRAGTLLWRVYFQGGDHPGAWDAFRAFGPLVSARFDHHTLPCRLQSRAIQYAAEHGPTCLAEVFQVTRTIDRNHRAPWLAAFELTRDVVLHDLSGAWPTRAGASTAIHSGPRRKARDWARSIYMAFPSVEGLRYCSSMDANRPAFALFERARSAIPATPHFHRALADPALRSVLDGAAARFGYVVV